MADNILHLHQEGLLLVLFGEMFAVYMENHLNYINAVYELNSEFSKVKAICSYTVKVYCVLGIDIPVFNYVM
jgi:hypothetical protein